MFTRLLTIKTRHNAFLFGARYTGKTTLLNLLCPAESSLRIDLLDAEEFIRFDRNPVQLLQIVKGLSSEIKYVIVDEIQRVPKLLNAIHKLTAETDKIFLMTGSSVRKLKLGGANLLAGRALTHQLNAPLLPQTSAYGEAFEHFIILECMRLASYNHLDFRFSYLQTQAGAEIDLIVERPGKKLLCIEIKSTSDIMQKDLGNFIALTKDIPSCEAICLCQEKYTKKIEHVLALPWNTGIEAYFGKEQ